MINEKLRIIGKLYTKHFSANISSIFNHTDIGTAVTTDVVITIDHVYVTYSLCNKTTNADKVHPNKF